MRRTKIICTLGPATEKADVLRQLIQKGADVLRLNMSHATHEWVREIVPRIRRLAQGKDRVRTRVLTPAMLGSRRHINLPRVHVNLPPLTKKDIADVGLGAELGVDFVALSFVREKGDIEQLRQLLSRKKSKAQIVAKIEDQLAVRSIDKMIESADVIMIARGDLGIECPMEELPIVQRRIAKKCIRLGKPVIVATQLLESMITNRLPTRAEVTDVANAVYEQADALM